MLIIATLTRQLTESGGTGQSNAWPGQLAKQESWIKSLFFSTREYRRKPVGRKELEALMDDEDRDPDYQEE